MMDAYEVVFHKCNHSRFRTCGDLKSGSDTTTCFIHTETGLKV